MDAIEVDPRYTSGLDLAPNYRVDFWDYVEPADGCTDPADLGRQCSSWRLTGVADVEEALAWIDDAKADRIAVLYLEYEDGETIGLARLWGDEPADLASGSDGPAGSREVAAVLISNGPDPESTR